MSEIHESRILLVDDNRELCTMVLELMKKAGFSNIKAVYNVSQAREELTKDEVKLWILDVNLPDGSGFSFMEELRERSAAPVLFLSARDEDEDRLLGLGLGADDYMTKPFLMKELILRVSAILRRTYHYQEKKEGTDKLILGNCQVDFKSAVAQKDGAETALTAKELLLLKKLAENRGNIVTFDTLCETIWGDSYYGYENTLMVHMRRLREKVEEDPSHPRYLLTVRGLGYKMAK
ncbi:MAG TPA: response regulator transcription factor [Candidatus Blautia faecavium]|uniref:Stage 0 sporulation protein A homolog n=1 Tax=Candidatus Blautia faecavium TaxID=2838487 RepID=A0A9D2LV14_9FIRM|nr:response regulator transcription factor [Candidatus Blautia faecavium]